MLYLVLEMGHLHGERFLVARGFNQVKGVDFKETLSLVIKFMTMQLNLWSPAITMDLV